jgi:methylated-DNA-[protein]-cysteine S-methyltransferase
VAPAGTPFQRRVWQRLSAIPAGETLTYGALARELGTSARAVGGACRTNPIPLVIPCHRVVATNGLGGYSGERGGDWLAKKRWLLAHEGVPT